MLEAAAPALAPLFETGSLLISILAGKTVANLAARLPARAIVRAMPNTPAAIGRGITGAYASAEVTPAQRETAQSLLSGVGAVEWVGAEHLIDAVTAISGSGPAYVFHLVEALAEAGAALGLPADLALRLARATVEGSGELLHRSPDTSAETLRKNVTSPGGTTQAALDVLMAPGGPRRAVGPRDRGGRETRWGAVRLTPALAAAPLLLHFQAESGERAMTKAKHDDKGPQTKADPREKIIDALMGLAAERSWDAIALADVADRAGVTLAQFRDFFPSRAPCSAASRGASTRSCWTKTTTLPAKAPRTGCSTC